MNPQDDREFREIVGELAAGFDRKVEPWVLSAWWKRLDDISVEDFRLACERVAKTVTEWRWVSIAKIREAHNEIQRDANRRPGVTRPPSDCETCDGTGWAPSAFYTAEWTGRESKKPETARRLKSVRPCPHCTRGRAFARGLSQSRYNAPA